MSNIQGNGEIMKDEQLAELGKHIATQLAENDEFVGAIAHAILNKPIEIEWNAL